MCNMPLKRLRKVLILVTILTTLYVFGVFTHLFEKDFHKEFHYPYDGEVHVLVQQLRNNVTPDISPINRYDYKYLKGCKSKCQPEKQIRLVYLVKSAMANLQSREAIRITWGYERRFSDVEIRTVFLLGAGSSKELQKAIDEESAKFSDIIQADYVDAYFNNTIKTMMGFKWAANFCHNSQFYMFVDDDFYVSTKNVLRYVRNPTGYPQYVKETAPHIKHLINTRKPLDIFDYELPSDVQLYSGYAFNSSPLRHRISKWYVSLEEYPYHMWPPYVTAGAYILSNEALKAMYYTSFYTKHFRFDDIYVALLAYKSNIEPYHSEYFHFYKQSYNKPNYEFTIASHGYENPQELLKVWNEQKFLGNA